jgi:hypothetical protein
MKGLGCYVVNATDVLPWFFGKGRVAANDEVWS